MTKVLEINNLCKRYSKKQPWVLDDVSLACYEGEIVGLLGHNGAGKSTLLKCILSMHPFSKGTITVCGHSAGVAGTKAKSNIGFVTDNHAVFTRMTGREYLYFMADIYGLGKVRKDRIAELDSMFGLGDNLDRLIMHYSHGMKQKVCMMGSLLHRPKLWVLDEPMTGLDPNTMLAIKRFIVHYASMGNTVLFSSHDVPTVRMLCHRIVSIKDGNMIVTNNLPVVAANE